LRYSIHLITAAALVAMKRKASEVEVEDISRVRTTPHALRYPTEADMQDATCQPLCVTLERSTLIGHSVCLNFVYMSQGNRRACIPRCFWQLVLFNTCGGRLAVDVHPTKCVHIWSVAEAHRVCVQV
jgi:hypothetical protein